jgi:hypothetical protein
LHHANASRFKAIAELSLLEDHIVNDPCPDCMNKHAITAARLMSEAATLEEGDNEDLLGSDLIEAVRRKIHPEPDIPLAREARDIRKTIQKKLNLSKHDDSHEDHVHAHPANDDIANDNHAHVHDHSPALVAGTEHESENTSIYKRIAIIGIVAVSGYVAYLVWRNAYPS